MSHLDVLMLSVLSFGCLAMAVERQQEDVFGRRLAAGVTKVLWWAGWLLLVVSLVLALREPLSAVGAVAWFGCISAAAGLVFLSLVMMSRVRVNRAVKNGVHQGRYRG